MNNKRFLSILSVFVIITSGLVITPSVKADSPSLCEALDNCELEWTSPNDRFYGQTDKYYYDGDSAECTDTGGNLKATVYDSKGTFKFYWRTTCKNENDGWEINFWIRYKNGNTVDGSVAFLSGNDYNDCDSGWQQHQFTLTEEADYEFVWMFSDLNGGDDTGSDIKAWVDKVEWINENQNNPPNTPSNPSPANNEQNIGVEGVTLSWNGGDPDGDSVSYDVFLNVAEDPDEYEAYATGLSSPQVEDVYLCAEQTYFWRVIATDEHGLETKSPIWEFNSLAVSECDTPDNTPPESPSEPTLNFPLPIHFNPGDFCILGTTPVDPDGDNMNLYWDMDEDDIIDFEICNVTSGEEVNIFYIWNKPAGQYNVRVYAEDSLYVNSGWSDSLFLNVYPSDGNTKPKNATIPSGIDSGFVGKPYRFTTFSTDPDNDKIKFKWDFGDGTVTDWEENNWIESGTVDSYTHSWDETGYYNVRVKVKDFNGATSAWSDYKRVNIIKKNKATIFDKDDLIGAAYGDSFDLLQGQGRLMYANGNTGAIVTGAYAGFPFGHSWSTACQGVDFYVGREKNLKIDVELSYVSGTEHVLPAYTSLYKTIRIDNFYNPKKEFKDWINNIGTVEDLKEFATSSLCLIGATRSMENILAAYKASQAAYESLYSLKHAGDSMNYVVQMSKITSNGARQYYTQLHRIKTSGAILTKDVGMSSTTATSTSGSASVSSIVPLWLIINVAFELWTLFQLMTHWQVDTLLDQYEQNGQGHSEHYVKSYTFDKGDHNVWGGMLSDAVAPPPMFFGFAYAAGKVKSITIEGISPPEKPVLYYPDTVNVGQSVEFKPYCIDQNDDPVQYIINWGDGKSTTTDFYDSGEEGLERHIYSTPGDYTITVQAKDCDRMTSEVNTFDITVEGDYDGPDVRITCPEDAFYLRGNNRGRLPFPIIFDDITLEAEVDPSDNVDYVQFYIEGKLKKTDDSYPYTYDWTEFGVGYKDIEVVAFNGKTGYDSKRAFYINIM